VTIHSHPDNAELAVKPIGFIKTPFKQKFGIPRQPNLAKDAVGTIRFSNDINVRDALEGIEQFSHLWLIFHFHQHTQKDISMKVRPPRLGGNSRIGVFASRSSFRPNPLGLSVVANLGVFNNQLKVSGVDLMDQTPIIDIKPYIAYADAIPDAECGYAQTKPSNDIRVLITDAILKKLDLFALNSALITQILSQDPRPAHAKSKHTEQNFDTKMYKMRVGDADLHWSFTKKDEITVLDVLKAY